MKAMILAAGYGTRLRPLTYHTPKPMVPVCNRPLIGYAVEAFIRYGVTEIIVNLHYLPEKIEQFLTGTYADQVKFQFSREREILGTGGGLRKVQPLLEKEEEFFLVNGDTIQFPPYEELHEVRKSKDALASLTLRKPPQTDRFTAVWYDDGAITGFGQGVGQALMFAGSHCISSRIFRYLPEKDFSGIVNEVYMPMIAGKKEIIAGIVEEEPWFDIGTPQRYIRAARSVLDMTLQEKIPLFRGSRIVRDSVVDNTANIFGDVARSSIGSGSSVRGAVRDSIIGANCRISGSVSLESCIVADEVEISRPLQLRNAVICRDDPTVPPDDNYRYESGLVIAEF